MRSDLGVVLDRCDPPGQPWTPAVRLPHRRDGLSALRMAVLWTFHRPLHVSPRAPRMNTQRVDCDKLNESRWRDEEDVTMPRQKETLLFPPFTRRLMY